MALRSTFGQVIEQVRNEARLSTNTSRGIDHLEHVKQLIKRHYYTLAEEYDWQHLEIKRDSDTSRKILQAGSRYYNWPAALNPLKVARAWVKWGSSWLPLDYGITYNQRSAYDPDADQRADPITNWMFYGGDQFEVWPLPASDGTANGVNEVAFEGQKLVETLDDNDDRLDMDDLLVSLMAATEILAENGQETAAKVKADAATSRLGRLRANLSNKTRFIMGRGTVGDSPYSYPRHPTFVR